MYNGWKNRETWNAALWVSNDEGMDAQISEAAEHACATSPDRDDALSTVAHAIENLYDDLMEPCPAPIRDLVDLSGVDWEAVAEAYIETCWEEPEPEAAEA